MQPRKDNSSTKQIVHQRKCKKKWYKKLRLVKTEEKRTDRAEIR